MVENNKLIAEFIGWTEYRGLNRKWNGSFDTNNLFHVNKTVEQHEIIFHSSWDWLMPVVEKIENLYEVGDFVINSSNVCISGESKSGKFFGVHYSYSPNTSKIDAVWLACVEFIKWYNENN